MMKSHGMALAGLALLAAAMPVRGQSYLAVSGTVSASPAPPLDLFHAQRRIEAARLPVPEVKVAGRAHAIGRAPDVRLSAVPEFQPILAGGQCVALDAGLRGDRAGGRLRMVAGRASAQGAGATLLQVSFVVPLRPRIRLEAPGRLAAPHADPLRAPVWTATLGADF